MSAFHHSRPSTGMAARPTTGRPWTGRSRPTTARPWTGQSRPDTARPQTAVSTRHENSCVISVLEGRGVAHEVGIAALDKDTGRVMLMQVYDIHDICVNSADDGWAFSLQMVKLMSRLCSASTLTAYTTNSDIQFKPNPFA